MSNPSIAVDIYQRERPVFLGPYNDLSYGPPLVSLIIISGQISALAERHMRIPKVR